MDKDLGARRAKLTGLQAGQLPFDSGNPALLLFDGPERTFQPDHPAVECGTLFLQLGATLLDLLLLSWIEGGWALRWA